MRCVKLVIPETGFVGEEKFVFHLTGGGVCVCGVDIFAEDVFIVCPGGRGDGKIG